MWKHKHATRIIRDLRSDQGDDRGRYLDRLARLPISFCFEECFAKLAIAGQTNGKSNGGIIFVKLRAGWPVKERFNSERRWA